ncbi:MAG: hypothetical protein NXH74_05930 [Rhodobacteraceae bacterium]|nr:hypothetical protein [Paracoccaceae bacterium]
MGIPAVGRLHLFASFGLPKSKENKRINAGVPHAPVLPERRIGNTRISAQPLLCGGQYETVDT